MRISRSVKVEALGRVVATVAALLSIGMFIAAGAAFAQGTPKAGILLSNAGAAFSQSSNTAWTLTKTGTVNTTNSTVTWTITGTQVSTVAGHLVVDGFMTVVNTGAGGAPIGNIVVNLQTKNGSSWATRSSDVADATHGDAATAAQIDPHASSENLSSFTENAASGPLSFMDAHTNTAFSIEPQVTIAPGAVVNLLFAAAFDNNVLKLQVGEAVRAEVIVSFGNASGGSSAPNVDINGNGTIDASEAYVRSVPVRLGGTVPAQTAGNATVTLSDAASDIATTGTATSSDPVFNLNQNTSTGTVTVSYTAGTSGGTITNCAHLTGASSTTTVGGFTFPNVSGITLQACDTEIIPSTAACTPGTLGCGWKYGDVVTYSQAAWAGDPGSILSTNFLSVYPAGAVFVGDPSGFSITFGGPAAIEAYLPASGTPAALDANAINPTSTSSGVFGGEVLALELNVRFADAAVDGGASATRFGDLRVCALSAAPAFNGMKVRDFLSAANVALGGGPAIYDLGTFTGVSQGLNAAFLAGAPSGFAQTSLFVGGCPAWKDGDVITYTQGEWGSDPTTVTAAALIQNDYNTVYAATGGTVVVGGNGGFSMTFTNAGAVLSYLPVSGGAGVLDANVVNTTLTSSGSFGAEVLALRLNIDYSDAMVTTGATPVRYGDLSICNIAAYPLLNGLKVRQFMDVANTVLGGGAGPYGLTVIDTFAIAFNGAFDDGGARLFAQQSLVNGACH